MIKKLIFVSLIFTILIAACKTTTQFRENYATSNALLHSVSCKEDKPFLKAHLKDGSIVILKDTWKIDTVENQITGKGQRYDYNRKLVNFGIQKIPFVEISLYETNKKFRNNEDAKIVGLCILTVANLAGTAICLSNPKACFGSCPTFYINENDNFHFADAEGFSNAITPSMEYADVDALNNKKITSKYFDLTMKNEALETHCINDVKLFAFPRLSDERIYHTQSDEFLKCKNIYTLKNAIGKEGDITELLKKEDRTERFSLSDEQSLNTKEEILLDFENPKLDNQNLGLILHFRQTLMTTYLFYSAMGYMGDEVADVFSKVENNNKLYKKSAIDKLGGIEVFAWNDNKNAWKLVDNIEETGPIAINKRIIDLKNFENNNKRIKIKLVLNKGLWRIDYTALTNIIEKVKPIEIKPYKILNNGIEDAQALTKLLNPMQHLISMPGNLFKYNFELPKDDTDYELFLCSKGYYIEWMRDNWLKEKNISKLRQMLLRPEQYFRDEAKPFKMYEKYMEEEFWNSKIETNQFVTK